MGTAVHIPTALSFILLISNAAMQQCSSVLVVIPEIVNKKVDGKDIAKCRNVGTFVPYLYLYHMIYSLYDIMIYRIWMKRGSKWCKTVVKRAGDAHSLVEHLTEFALVHHNVV